MSSPTRVHRVHVLAFIVVLSVLAAACGSGDDDEALQPLPTSPDTPAPTPAGEDGGADGTTTADDSVEPTATPVEPTPTPRPTPTPEPGEPTVVFAVFTNGGFVPVEVALSTFPQLVIHSDGTVYRQGAQIAVFPGPLTPAIERIQLTPEQLDEIRQAVEATQVISPDTDYGSPTITDVGSTAVTSFFDGTERTTAAYALGIDDGVGGAAEQARAELRSLLATVDGIVDAASGSAEVTQPPAVAVITFVGLGVEENAQPRPWPIDSLPREQPGGTACVIVTGEELDTLWQAAADATVLTPWQLGDTVAPVALRPVFPHENVC